MNAMKTTIAMCVLAGTVGALALAGCQAGVRRHGRTACEIYSVPACERIYDGYTVKVCGRDVPVSEARCSAMPFNRRWPGHQRSIDQSEQTGMVRFAFDGTARVEVTAKKEFKDVKIRPLSRGVKPRVNGRTVTFDITRPGGYSVEFDGYHHNLHVFADAKKDYGIGPEMPGVRYFGPGAHNIGITQVKSGETIYLDPGAIVYGALDILNATNVTILGRGILDSSRVKARIKYEAKVTDEMREKSQHGQMAVLNAERHHAVSIRRSKGVRIDGLTLRDANCYNIGAYGVEDIEIDNVKIVGQWRYNTDGIDLHNVRHARVRDCFARTFDDTYCVKAHGAYKTDSEDVVFERCVAWSDWGKSLEVGVECQAEHLRDLTFRDCDVIHSVVKALDVQNVDWGSVSNVLFEDIRFENDDPMPCTQLQKQFDEKDPFVAKYRKAFHFFEAKLFFHPEYSTERGEKYRGAGHIDGVTLRNVSVTSAVPVYASAIGFDEKHRVTGVTFENVTVNGRKIASAKDLDALNVKFADAPTFK